MPIKFGSFPYYLSAVSQLVTCNPVVNAEGSHPLGLSDRGWYLWLCMVRGQAIWQPPHSWNTQLPVELFYSLTTGFCEGYFSEMFPVKKNKSVKYRHQFL